MLKQMREAKMTIIAKTFAMMRGRPHGRAPLSRRLLSLLTPTLSLLLSLSVLPASADVKSLVDGNKISWDGSPERIYLLDNKTATEDSYDELVLKFTDISETNNFTIASGVKVSVRALVVGGGGAGGTSTSTTAGAGGGGGAGGFIDTTMTLENDTFKIIVGAGGPAATSTDTKPGNDGFDSSFTGASTNLVAKGGGGGGAQSAGRSGGSGGGGSYGSSALAGGSGEDDQGNNGGRGATKKFGAGGGGAGEAGYKTTTTTGPGAGGDGLYSDIILGADGLSICYAGGGGGGSATSLGVQKSKGGGGGGAKKDETEAGDGTDGLGGGGGGGGNACAGGKGGDGVVILRIRDMLIEPPESVELEWNNENQVGYEPKNYYEIVEVEGDATNGTAAANYRYHVKPAGDFEWKTWTTSKDETKEITWKIVPQKIDIPTSISVTYDGESHEVASSDEICEIDGIASAVNAGEYSFTTRLKDTTNTVWEDGSVTNMTTTWYILAKEVVRPSAVQDLVYEGTNAVVFTAYDGVVYVSGATNSVNAGSFNYTVALDNPAGYTNYVWAGATGDASVANVTIDWEITPKSVDVPVSVEGLVYNGDAQNGFAALDWTLYELASGTTNETSGGSYKAVFHLTGNGEADNYVWSTDPATGADQTVSWSIGQAANEITALELTGWRVGETPNVPSISATWGGSTVKYSYGFGASEGSVTNWISNRSDISEPGIWICRAVIPETANWAAATGTAAFVMWSDPGQIFRNRMEITIKGSSAELTDFVVPVRISEERMPGFYYDAASINELVFLDEEDTLLSYDVDTWNTNGESVVWLKLPTLPTAGRTVMMYWNLAEGHVAPENDATKVWSAYAGVWHMTDANDSAAGASPGKLGNKTTAVDGIFGGALSASQTGEPLILATASDAVNAVTGGAFTVSFYTKYNSTTHGSAAQYLFSRRTVLDDAGYALCINGGLTSSATQFIECFGERSGRYSINDTTPMTKSGSDKWVRNDVVYTPNRFYWYINGEELYWTRSMTSGFSNGTTGHLGIGGLAAAGSDSNINGAMDEFRIRAGALDGGLISAEYAYQSDSTLVTNGVVYLDGLKVDYWVEEPALLYPDKLKWDVDPAKDTPNEFASFGKLRYGEVTNYIYSVYETNKVYSSLAEITESDTYCAVFFRVPTDDFQPIEKTFTFTITASKPYTKIGGTNGNSGRVLLMNRDTNTNCPIDFQAYSDTQQTRNTFWHLLNSDGASDGSTLRFNLSAGTESILWTQNFGEKLWHVIDCRHGNTYPAGVTAGSLDSDQNYLPYSSTSYSFLNRSRRANQSTAGQVVMRNISYDDTNDAPAGPAVYSPCYTNGIGTIYFDAVNGWAGVTTNYNIVVEYATSTVDGLEPTDANCAVFSTNTVEGVDTVSTNWYGKLDSTCWKKATMRPFVRDLTLYPDGNFVETNSTDVLSLQIEHGGTAGNFYRVVVPLDIKTPVRFRIRRVTHLGGWDEDTRGFILLDNIIASPPASGASLGSQGEYFGDRTGKQQLGWELATSVPYPSVEDAEIYGRAKSEYYVSSELGSQDTNTFFQTATMHWRWRYLDQTNTTWEAIELNPRDSFGAMEPFRLPGKVCDVEYWYEYTLQAPYYSYVDYSGVGKAVAYTEERGVCTNALDSTTLPSGGTNWFFRVREGASEFERMVLTIYDTTDGGTTSKDLDMDLVGSHQWRGFAVVTNKSERAISFFITGLNPLAAGATEFKAKTETVDISSAPYSGFLVSVGEEAGYRAAIHYQTNVSSRLEFRFNDETKAISISHADYQDFNEWHSSRCSDAANLKFYSSAVETNSTTVAKKRYPARDAAKTVESFSETPRTSTAWYEPFAIDSAQSQAGFPKNEPFESAKTPNGWFAEHGMWVAQKWGMTNSTDFALQLEGCGNGAVTFNETPVPYGLDTIDFTARLAQFNEFKNVSFNWNKIMRSNYTVAAQACFDQSPTFANFSGEASVSLFAGYVPYTGGYEYRITIYNVDDSWKEGSSTITRACVRHGIYRWSAQGAKFVAEPLVEVDHTNSGGWYWTKSSSQTTQDMVQFLPLGLNGANYSGMYMSFSNDNGRVVITAGVTNGKDEKQSLTSLFTYSDKDFQQIGCVDADPVTKFGTYGVLIKNCPGRVYFPRVYDGKTVQIPSSGATAVGNGQRWKGKVPLIADTGYSKENEGGNIGKYWALDPGRMVEMTGSQLGVAADTNLAEKVAVYTSPVDSENWTCVTNIEVSSFASAKSSVVLQTREQRRVKFKSGGESSDVRTDIVVDDITLSQWCGQAGSVTNASSSYGYADYFYHTGTWVSNRVSKVGTSVVTNRCALLAPRRAGTAATPVGIRSPYMDGLGAIVFDYCDAGEGAELVLQRWTGPLSYLSGHIDDAQDDSDWQFVTNWTFKAGESGTKSYYYGLRSPSNGVFRIVIPQANVREAFEHGEYDPNWKAVTVTDVYTFDEPAFDRYSWWGWNFLTTGWDDGEGNDYAALDDFKDGAAGALNNSLAVSSLETGRQDDYTGNDPFVQSPTFSGGRTVGEIDFRARALDGSSPAYVTVWGAKSGDLQKKTSWTAITNVVVDSVFFARHTVKCSDEEGYAAIRLGVANLSGIQSEFHMDAASAAALPDSPVRVLVDEIVVRERVKPKVGFRLGFVRPFRLGLSDSLPVLDIASRDQQPLLNEQFGFQAEVEITGLADEVDLDRTPEVYLSFYPKAEPWGYANWKEAEGAVLDILLEPAEGTNLVFRSMSTTPLSFAGPFEADPDLDYGMVQYYLTVKYWDKGGDPHTSPITAQQWQMPSWYQGFEDPNQAEDAEFSPFTVLDTVSPGRAWFNEVNFSDENGSGANQFVEVCFPAGYDMTGWRIYRYDVWGKQNLLASLGLTTGVPATKDATGGDPNFAFLALTDSSLPVAGADAYWNRDIASCDGLGSSYGFQLVRPSGIIEHQVVVEGNLGSSPWGKNKAGTNVVAQLEERVGGTWSFVGVDTNAAIKSTGVFRNAGVTPDDWNDVMDMTPGMMNCPGQIPDGWFLPPSGTNVWLTLSTTGGLVWIVDGEELATAKTLIVPLDMETNLVFETAPWHQLGSLMRDVTNDVTAAAARSAGVGGTNVWTYAFKETARNSATLQATAAPDADVLVRGELDPADPYTPAVMNWLLGGMANGEPFEGTEISTNCFFYDGLSTSAKRSYLSLKERYWYDIDPTSDAWDLLGGFGEFFGTTAPVAGEVRRSPDVTGYWPTPVTNRIYTFSMMITNKNDAAKIRPPNRLQGLGGEKSDVVGARNWTSETFKVTMSLIKRPEDISEDSQDVSQKYMPIAAFVFNGDSFGAPDGPHPFAARIEVTDPMSSGSPAYTYNWWLYPNSTYGYSWNLKHGMFLKAPDMLKSTNTWDRTWEAHDDY